MAECDRSFMQRALDLARQGWGQTAPNPLVGAVVVRDGEIVGEGFHARYGGDHAEVVALRAAGDRARGATVYVTLEPCAHTGKTPPCTDALIAAGVARVVAACRDPSPVAQGGLARLAATGIETEVGVEADAAYELNAPFFYAIRATRPWVTLKYAMSLDGALTNAERRVGWFTSATSRRVVHHLRAGADAIAVGIATVLADDPALTVREAAVPPSAPVRIVFDRHARLPLNSQLVRTARDAPTVVVVRTPDLGRQQRLEEAGVRVVTADSLEDALQHLRRPGVVTTHGVRSLLVEGGAHLGGALWEAGVVDRLIIFQAPVVFGAEALQAFAYTFGASLQVGRRLPIVDQQRLEDDLMTVYALTRVAECSPD